MDLTGLGGCAPGPIDILSFIVTTANGTTGELGATDSTARGKADFLVDFLAAFFTRGFGEDLGLATVGEPDRVGVLPPSGLCEDARFFEEILWAAGDLGIGAV